MKKKTFDLSNFIEKEAIEEEEKLISKKDKVIISKSSTNEIESKNMNKEEENEDQKNNEDQYDIPNLVIEKEKKPKELRKEIHNHRKLQLENEKIRENKIVEKLKEKGISINNNNNKEKGNENFSNFNNLRSLNNYFQNLSEREKFIQHQKKLKDLSKLEIPVGIIDRKLNIGFSKSRKNKEELLKSNNVNEIQENEKYINITRTPDEELEKIKLSNEKKKIKDLEKDDNQDFIGRVKENKIFLKNLNLLTIDSDKKFFKEKEKTNLIEGKIEKNNLNKGKKSKKYVPFSQRLRQNIGGGSFLSQAKNDKIMIKNYNSIQRRQLLK